MSLWDDYKADAQFAEDEARVEYEEMLMLTQNKQWRTKDGTVLNVSDMSSDHLQNALNLLKRIENPSELNALQRKMFVDEINSRQDSVWTELQISLDSCIASFQNLQTITRKIRAFCEDAKIMPPQGEGSSE